MYNTLANILPSHIHALELCGGVKTVVVMLHIKLKGMKRKQLFSPYWVERPKISLHPGFKFEEFVLFSNAVIGKTFKNQCFKLLDRYKYN